MKNQLKQKFHNESKRSGLSLIEKKINLMIPIYLHRKINKNNTQERQSPKYLNFPFKEYKCSFDLKSKLLNQPKKSHIMNSIEINKYKEIKNTQKLKNSNARLEEENILNILNKKKENKYENSILGNRKIKKKTKDLNENKENIMVNYNDKANMDVNLNSYNNNINKLENNLNLNNMKIQNNNIYPSVQKNKYIKNKIISFEYSKNENNKKDKNISDLNIIRNYKNDLNSNRTGKLNKNVCNFMNNNNNSLNNRIIRDYASNNSNNQSIIFNNFLYDNSFIVNASSLQKRKISFNGNIKTPDNNNYIINYKRNNISEKRLTNSCYLDNILSFRKIKQKIFYKSPLNKNKCPQLNLQMNKINRDLSDNKRECEKKKSFLLKKNLLKYPSSRDTTFKQLNIKNGINSNSQKSYISLNYVNTDSIDNSSFDSCNKKILDKFKKNFVKGQNNFYLKLTKEKFSKTIKEYSNKCNKKNNMKIDNKDFNKVFPGETKYNFLEKEKLKKIYHRTITNFNNKAKKYVNLIDDNDILIKLGNSTELSSLKKIKKMSKSSSCLINKSIDNNDKMNILKKNKIVTPKKIENQQKNKILNISSKNLPQTQNQYKNGLEKNNQKKKKSPDLGKKNINNSNRISDLTTTYKYSTDNATKSVSNSSFILNEEIKNSKINENTNNINIKIYEEEKIIDFYLLYTLESKLKMLLIKINNYQICYNECQDWISYFFGINFYEKELILFDSEQNKNQIKYFIKFELLCYLMCYDISFNKNYSQTSILLKTIFNLLHKNYLILISYAIKTINEINKNKDINFNNNSNFIEQMIIIKKLQEVINNELKMNLEIQDVDESIILQIFSYNFKQINNYYEMIIENVYSLINEANKTNIISFEINNNYRKSNYYNFPDCLKINILKLNDKKKLYIISNFFKNVLQSIDLYSIKDFKLFFNLYLNKSTDNLFIQQYYNNKRLFSLIPSPFLSPSLNPEKNLLPPTNKEKYKYTLILDLDETLIYLEKEYYTFNNIHSIKNKKLTLRPGLFNFLDRMKKIYEIILFTFSSPEYANPIIQLIEKNGKYFEHILYIEQASYNNDNFVKNIRYLGREIENTIIIEDNINNIFYYNRDNLICIKPFYGDISNENNTLQLLGNILNKIRYDAEITGDISKSLHKERYTIITEISTNLEE